MSRAVRSVPAATARPRRPALHRLLHPAVVLPVGVPVAVAAAAVVPAAALLVLGACAVLLALPVLRRLAEGAAWCVPPLVALVCLLLDFQGRSNAPGPYRYVPTLAVLLAIVLVGVRPDASSRAVRATAVVLFGYGILGTLYGRFVFGTINGTLPLVGPMLIACLPPVRNWLGPAPGADGWRTGLRVLSVTCSLFAVFAGLTRLGLLPAAQVDVVNHEKSFVFVLAIGAAWVARDRILLVVALAATAFAFSTYPAASYALALAVALLTVLVARLRPDATSRVLLAVGAAVTLLLAMLYVDRLIELSTTYFQLVGKDDNGQDRAELYAAALDRLEEPLFSSFFTGDITVVGTFGTGSQVVPVHNDYLAVTLGGGIVAATLLVSIFLFANGLVIRTLRAGVDAEQRRTVVLLLAGVNAGAASAFANPLFMNPGASALMFALLAGLVAACRRPGPPTELDADWVAPMEVQDLIEERGAAEPAPAPRGGGHRT